MKFLIRRVQQQLVVAVLVFLPGLSAIAHVSVYGKIVSKAEWNNPQSPETSPHLNINLTKDEFLKSNTGIWLTPDDDVMPEAVRSGDRLLVRFFNDQQAISANAANVAKLVITRISRVDETDNVTKNEIPVPANKKIVHTELIPNFDVDSAPPQKISVELQDDQGQLVGERLWIKTNPTIKVLARLFRSYQPKSREAPDTTEQGFEKDVGTRLTESPHDARPDIRGDDFFEVRCFRAGQPVTIGDCKIDHIAIKINNKPVERHTITNIHKEKNYFFFETDSDPFIKASYASPIEFQVIYSNERAGPTFYSKRRNNMAAYGYPLGHKNASFGLWFPVGLLVSNLESTSSGIVYSALPAGVAIGTKIYAPERVFESDWYLGLSLMATYAITNMEDTTSIQAQQDEKPPSKVALASASAGLLVDIGGYIYVACVYVFDFKDRNKPGFTDPGIMIGFGFGPRLPEVLKPK